MKNDNKFYLESNPNFYKSQAKKALKKAKQLEDIRQNEGKKYIQINSKTRVLR